MQGQKPQQLTGNEEQMSRTYRTRPLSFSQEDTVSPRLPLLR